jgi:dihydrofolate reductase
MHTFIIAAISADGYIAKDEHHPAFWTSKEDKKRFVELTKRAGVVVMGSSTFKTLPRPLKERVNIVYSRSQTFEGAEVTQKNPVELLAELESRGFKEVAICGGSYIYSMFMKSNMVNMLYLTVEPIIFGAGVRLFNEEMHFQLTLVSSVQTENGALLLEYKVNHAGTPRIEPATSETPISA